MKYEIKEFKMIPVADLIPHPDAQAYPSDEDDRCALDASIEGVGVLEPLTVIESAIEYLVIDGCGRLEDAQRSGTRELPCLVVECDDPRAFAAHKNAMGRKRSTGSRVLCYLMANRELVLKAAELASREAVVSRDTTGKRVDLPDYLKPWSTLSIAKRMHVSNKDVVSAVQLVSCQTGGVDPDGDDLDEALRVKMEKTFNAVMCARTPVRRWKAAFGGAEATAEKAKADVNLPVLARRTAPTIVTMFQNWPAIKWDSEQQRVESEQILVEAMEILPDFLHAALAQIIVEKWPSHEKKALEKALKGSSK
jgi:hypothetical protein